MNEGDQARKVLEEPVSPSPYEMSESLNFEHLKRRRGPIALPVGDSPDLLTVSPVADFAAPTQDRLNGILKRT